MISGISSIDIFIFKLFNHAGANPAMDAIVKGLTELGTGELISLIALILLFLPSRKHKLAGVILLAGLTLSYHATHIIKEIIQRPRPFMALEGVNILFKEKGFSFPSTHSTMAFMAATVAGYFSRKYWLFYAVAVLVAFSRLYLGVHYPSDVFCGALVGITVGALLLKTAQKIEDN